MNQLENRIKPYALKQDEGWTYRFGIDFTVKASEIQNGSGTAVLTYVTRKGEEPPDHTHASEDEMFYVLQGAITFRCDSKFFDLEQGDFIVLPRGIEHDYAIHNDEPVQLLVVTSPIWEGSSAGWGGFVSDYVTQQPVLGQTEAEVGRNGDRAARIAQLSVRSVQVTLSPPVHHLKKKELSPITVWAVHVIEDHPPKSESPIEWLLLTSVPTTTFEEACERVRWYAARWLIEMFHKIGSPE